MSCRAFSYTSMSITLYVTTILSEFLYDSTLEWTMSLLIQERGVRKLQVWGGDRWCDGRGEEGRRSERWGVMVTMGVTWRGRGVGDEGQVEDEGEV
jgi:hypothetical protein